ncbi:hypothetical protein ACQCR9_07805, partial [Ralstonia pseudosolanacearum]
YGDIWGARLSRARIVNGYLADRLCAAGLPVDTLSMGMSADLEDAIAEGATIVRVGSAIFGARQYAHAPA